MERLIRVIKARGKSVVVYTKGKYEDTTAGEMEHKDIRNVMKRLSDYEDTGLTPPEIRELKERDTAKKVELINGGVPVCPECGAKVLKHYTFCRDCGQKLEQ